MSDEATGYIPTPEDETKAEKAMTNEQKVANNALYETLKPLKIRFLWLKR